MTQLRFITAIVLVVLLAALYFGLNWPWGLLLVYWAFLNVKSGGAFLVGPVDRNDDALFYWLITVLWIVLGVIMLLSDFAPQFISGMFS